MYENIYLTRLGDDFTFPYKVYGQDSKFIERVYKTWQNTDSNLGVLLNGLRGTGKTVTAQQLCNKLKKPVLILTKRHKHLLDFLNNIQQDYIFFMDEYEKMFDRNDHTMLTIMDGVLKTTHRVLFLMTTNSTNIESNLLQRPSRIRYVKEYGDLPVEVIKEIVNDMLEHKQWTKETISVISHLPMITIDLVKCLIQEVNIHNENPEEFKDFLNITDGSNDDYFTVVRVVDNKDEHYKSFADVYPLPCIERDEADLNEEVLHKHLYINNRDCGRITCAIDNNTFIVSNREVDPEATKEKGERVFKEIETTYKFEKTTMKHKSFKGAHSLVL
jgi:broad-specificity NMP kinase